MKLVLVLSALLSTPAFAAETATGGGNENPRNERALWDKDGNLLPDSEVNSPDVAWEILKNKDRRNDKWKSVGQMMPDSNNGSCTITLIEPPGGCEFDPNRKAMALTNGHCVGIHKNPDAVQINEPFSQTVHFNHFIDTQGSAIKAQISRTVYASMQGTDVAIVELEQTYAQLAGVEPKKIARTFDGSSLTNISSPTTGVNADEQFLRRSTCRSGGAARLSEGGYLWPRQIRVNCSVVGGASGSPLFGGSRDEIMGLVNTGVALNSGGTYCRMNLPCEIDGAKPGVQNTNYGFDVTFLHKCANQKCEIDPAKDGCALPDGAGPRVDLPTVWNGSSRAFDLDSRGADSPFQSYQVKWGPAGTTDCDSNDGYAPAAGNSFSPPVARGPDGMFVLCARGKTASGEWLTSAKTIRLDRQPPVAVLQMRNGGYIIRNDDPSDFAPQFNYKVVAKRAECAQDADYRRPSPMDSRLLRVRETSGYLCVRAFDSAGNYQSARDATVQALSN